MTPTPRRSTRARSPRYEPYKTDYGQCPAKPILESRYFYAASDAKFAITNHDHATSVEFPATPEKINGIRFDARKWQNIPRPANYHGTWPPTSASQLMNTDISIEDMGRNRAATRFQKTHGEQINEDCLGKFCWQEAGLAKGVYCLEAECDHAFTEWLTGQARWRERFEIRRVSGMGYGLYSRKNLNAGWNGTWRKDDILGVYLGELIPRRTGNTDYCHEVSIGPEFEKKRAPVAYIDAEKCGNYVRFCNHSCESNAKIFEARVGKERVLALRATKSIVAGEQICIDYGNDYFRCRRCLCGSAKCKYPNAVNVVTVVQAIAPAKSKKKCSEKLVQQLPIRNRFVFEMDTDIGRRPARAACKGGTFCRGGTA